MQDCTRAREIAFDHNILDPLVPFSLSLSGFRHIHLFLCLSAIASVPSHGPTSTWLKQSPVSSTRLAVKQSCQLLKHFQSCCQNLTSLPAGSRLARGECSRAALSLSAATFSAGKGQSTFYLLTNAFIVPSSLCFYAHWIVTAANMGYRYGSLTRNNNIRAVECHEESLMLNGLC